MGEGGDKTREETRLISIPFVPTFSVTELLCPLHGQNERGCVDEPPNCKQQHRRHFSPRPSFSHLSLLLNYISVYLHTVPLLSSIHGIIHSRSFVRFSPFSPLSPNNRLEFLPARGERANRFERRSNLPVLGGPMEKKKKTKGTVGTRGIFRSRPNTQQRKKGNEKREAIELLPTRVRNDHRTRARVDFTSIVDSLRYTRLMPITNKEEEEGERATIFVIQPPPTRIFNELYAIADRRP